MSKTNRMRARAEMLFRERDRYLDKARKIDMELADLASDYAQEHRMWGFTVDMLRREVNRG